MNENMNGFHDTLIRSDRVEYLDEHAERLFRPSDSDVLRLAFTAR